MYSIPLDYILVEFVFFYTCELCYIYHVMAKDRPEKPAKGIKRKNGEKDFSPKKRMNSGTTGGTSVGKNPGKNGVKSARKLAPHTVSKPPPTPAATKSSGKSDIPSSNTRSNAAVSPAVLHLWVCYHDPFRRYRIPSLPRYRE